jgi:glycosyltransferase involved in cell wall biosynthesis
MRIGIDARLAGPGLGVAGIIQALATGLPQLGLEVVWFGDPSLAPDAVAEVVRPPSPGFPGLDSRRGQKLVVERRLDLMHFAGNSGWWSSGPIPHVLTVHDVIWSHSARRGRSPRQSLGHTYLRFAVPRAIKGAAAVAVPSAAAAAALLRRYGANSLVIRNGIAETWRRRQTPINGDPYVVAFSARDPRKGTEIAVEASRHLASRGVKLVLLAGAGIPPRIADELARSQSAGRIEVLPYQAPDRLVDLVSGALAVLYPSRDEGFGLPVAEAMAAEVPVITGLAPVTLEIGGDAILALDARDPVRSAVRHVETLLDQPELRRSLGSRGRQRAAQFTWDSFLRGYRDLYHDVLAR